MSHIKKFLNDERGLEMSEYTILLALIAVAVVVAVLAFKDAIIDKFGEATAVLADN